MIYVLFQAKAVLKFSCSGSERVVLFTTDSMAGFCRVSADGLLVQSQLSRTFNLGGFHVLRQIVSESPESLENTCMTKS